MQFGLDGKGDSMQSGQRECSNWPVKKSIGLDGRTMNNHSCLPLLPQAITNLLVRTICLLSPATVRVNILIEHTRYRTDQLQGRSRLNKEDRFMWPSYSPYLI